MKQTFFILLAIIFPFCLSAQEVKPNQTSEEIIENYIEEISSNTDKEVDLTTLYEDLTFYLNEPLNLNTATKDELEKLQLLSDFQISSLLQYIKILGNYTAFTNF